MADTLPFADLIDVSKRFHATQALDQVSISFRPGEVHALIGENGAGKSTLIKILGGVHQPDTGDIRVAGTSRRFKDPREAMSAGIVVIPQEMRIVPAQTVAENVLLGDMPTKRLLGILPTLDRREMRRRAGEILGRLNLQPNLNAPISTLGYAERQLVMIARALNHDAQLLVLDEPTAALEAREVERLFSLVRGFKESGVATVFISHRLDEVEGIADICTVLRDGKVVGTAGVHVPAKDEMIRMMTGRDLEEGHDDRETAIGAEALHIDYITEGSAEDQSVSLRQGEILGMAGLLGSGLTEFLKLLYGANKEGVGLRLKGDKTQIRSPADAIKRGIGLVPNERGQGLIMGLTVRENIVLPNLPRLSKMWRLEKAIIDKLVAELIETVDIRPADPDRIVSELSGGNQQKVVFARWLAGNADVLLLDEPTHGIDVGAKAQIHALMRRFADDGGGIVFASSEMLELLSTSDNVLAVKDGTVVARVSREGGEGEYNEMTLRAALGG